MSEFILCNGILGIIGGIGMFVWYATFCDNSKKNDKQ